MWTQSSEIVPPQNIQLLALVMVVERNELHIHIKNMITKMMREWESDKAVCCMPIMIWLNEFWALQQSHAEEMLLVGSEINE